MREEILGYRRQEIIWGTHERGILGTAEMIKIGVQVKGEILGYSLEEKYWGTEGRRYFGDSHERDILGYS